MSPLEKESLAALAQTVNLLGLNKGALQGAFDKAVTLNRLPKLTAKVLRGLAVINGGGIRRPSCDHLRHASQWNIVLVAQTPPDANGYSLTGTMQSTPWGDS